MDNEPNSRLRLTAVQAALLAGSKIMEVYSGAEYGLQYKADESPLTEADQQAQALIANELEKTGIPILSEEGGDVPFSLRKGWERLWIVDPLDGTKEFIKKNGEFTVNIALVEKQSPLFGVIYAPDLKRLYFGGPGFGSFTRRIHEGHLPVTIPELIQSSEQLPLPQNRSAYVIMGSRSHATPELHEFVEAKKNEYREVDFISAGSSLKICKVAEGTADIYPRLGPTMEWDTAAGHAIATGAGKTVTVWADGSPLLYNRENLLNPWFVVR
ncbi:MAG: 3'(2'),5'-bisphosphate nucleotidase CysQ [Desulfohalobiaceae bacterium]|nr:3'(2'),5'-bisphosphate nucleotidase CysQ [Desulfohalobiaceae bacterium]